MWFHFMHCVCAAAAAVRLEFEQNPDAFLEKVKPDQEALTAKLVEARNRLNK
jgi:Mg-chelatase subunit ChlI